MMSAEWFVVLLVLAPCVRSYTEGYTELDGCNEGVIQTENFPGHYPPYATYVWNITVKAGFKVKFNFDMFCIESSPNSCSHDSVTIFYGSHVHDQPYCGDNVPPGPFISSGTNLRVEFRTNEDVSGCGFNGTYGPTVDTNPCQNEGYPTGCTCSCLPGLVGTYCELPSSPDLTLIGPATVSPGETIVLVCRWDTYYLLEPELFRLFRGSVNVLNSTNGYFYPEVTFGVRGVAVYTCTVLYDGIESGPSNSVEVKTRKSPVCDPNPCQTGGTCLARGDKDRDYYLCQCLEGLAEDTNCTIPNAPDLTLNGPSTVREGETIHLTCKWKRDNRLQADLHRLFQGQTKIAENVAGKFYVQVSFGDQRFARYTCTVICDGNESKPSAPVVVKRKSVCHPNPCENGGTCVAHDNGGGDQYRCKCVQGLTGHNCSQPKAPQLKLKHPGKKTVKQGDTIHFLCHWHSHLTPDHYRLFRNRSEVQKSKSGHFCVTLTSSDIGCIVFTCTVEINGRESVHSNGIVIIVKGRQIKKKDKSKKRHQKSHRQDKKSKSGGSRSSKERNSSPSHQDRKSPHRILMTPKSPVKVHSVKGSGHSSPKSSKSPES
ncbi:uncharacterized protein LOC143276230 [Babylonia areolata]|uniref:uncharacterized protein LOC143276230 n=1 Tax=Babylonia areolata TaxID=304850 RepID=UPI003FD57F85